MTEVPSVQQIAMVRQHRARARAYRRVLRAADAAITQNEQMAVALREMQPGLRDLRVIKQPGMHAGRAARLTAARELSYPGLADKLLALYETVTASGNRSSVGP